LIIAVVTLCENCFATLSYHLVADLSQISASVATTSGKSQQYFSVSQKTAILLHRRKETDDKYIGKCIGEKNDQEKKQQEKSENVDFISYLLEQVFGIK
jgi:hypothetical protein